MVGPGTPARSLPGLLLLVAFVLALVVAVAAAASRSKPKRYPVDWRHRYRLEHAHVQRLLRQLEHARHVQAVASRRSPPPPAGGGWPAHFTAWLCIHRYEGDWDANTGNGYYGGLQMDWNFMQAYGAELLAGKGTADHWTPLEQMQVAERAYVSGRGFWPWPNSARLCGLI